MQEGPEEFEDVVRRLRAERHEATPLELDAIKARAIARARARSTRPRPRALSRRLLIATVSLLVVGGTTGGVIAGTSSKSEDRDAAKGQYGDKPGKGCGDKRHVHRREGECKKGGGTP